MQQNVTQVFAAFVAGHFKVRYSFRRDQVGQEDGGRACRLLLHGFRMSSFRRGKCYGDWQTVIIGRTRRIAFHQYFGKELRS